jgi:hypothetical protein
VIFQALINKKINPFTAMPPYWDPEFVTFKTNMRTGETPSVTAVYSDKLHL